ncbi:L,D-transpeptidase [Acidobacterium sp. S8]|uniref:L,D-transpeptidase family protein n=1 Tax=Acidobacterium sp. S8 TaxID=1641854 RepID=UPI001C20315E|nr:L,D-transpeptidase family protein [Acidobacterium sp. S8]
MKLLSFFFCLLIVTGSGVTASAQTSASQRDPLAQSTQMIVVTTSGWNAVNGRLQRYERATPDDAWRPAGDGTPIVVGKNGLGWGIGVTGTNDANLRLAADPVKKEGDGKSPAGIFSLGTAFGDAPTPLTGVKLAYLSLTPSIECVDDTRSKYYNRVIDRSTVSADWKSSEHMRDVGEAYRWGIVVNHNNTVAGNNAENPRPGAGSCVFLHIWGGPDHGTAGCTAMATPKLETLLQWLDPKRNPLLVQLPVDEYKRLASQWKLPPMPAD